MIRQTRLSLKTMQLMNPKETNMLYKTIVLSLLQQRPEIHEKLRKARRLLPTLEYFAQELKRDHEIWMDLLWQAKPGNQPSQIASEAMEIGVKELEDRLPSEFLLNEAEPLSLDAAMAFINNIPTLPD